jgi:hypothetical protein
MVSPAIDTVPSGHDKHELTLTACTAKEYMFVGHSEQGALITTFLYDPGAHDRQSLRPVPPKPALHGQVFLLSKKICEPSPIASKSNAMSASDAKL